MLSGLSANRSPDSDAAGILLGLASVASAQEADVGAGAAYAKQVCAPCHAVLPNKQISPLPQGPTFQTVADTPL
jgi:mono/diheme cytochrome c family protein